MKRNTLAKLAACLTDLAPRIEVPEAVRLKAKRSIDRMLEMTAGQTLAPAGARS
jgi:quinolinate synthase